MSFVARRAPRAPVAVALAAAIALVALPAAAQPTMGPENQLDDILSASAYWSDMTGLPQGFLSVWASEPAVGGAPTVRGRLLDANGALLGSSFQVSTVGGNITTPAVDADANGTSTVVWGRDGTVQARRLDSSGAAVGAEFQVNTSTPANVIFPNVAATPAGEFVVAWNALRVTGVGYDIAGEIRARRLGSGGAPLGAEFQVNTVYPDRPGSRPGVAVDDSGDVLIVWGTRTNLVLLNSPFQSIDGRAFNASGAPIGGEFQVSNDARLGWPDVAFTESGSALAVWEASGPPAVALARRLATTGPTGPAFPVNTFTAGGRIVDPTLVTDPSTGDVLVTWGYDHGSTGSDTDSGSVAGRLLDVNDDAIGNEFQVNVATTGRQEQARVGAADGTFVVTWSTYDPNFTTGLFSSTQSRAVTAPVLCYDLDGDGYGSPASAACTFPDLDCDDTNPSVNPGAAEIPGNGLDDDCNASTPPQTGCNPQPQGDGATVY